MVRKTSRERQVEIKDAVLEIILKNGMRGLSTSRLGKRVGISDGAIFKHFRAKRDIILSIIDDVTHDLIEPLRSVATSKTAPQERLQRFMTLVVNYFVDHRGMAILLFSEASTKNDAVMLEKLNLIYSEHRSLVGQIIEDGINLGIWDKDAPVDDVTFLYMGIPSSLNINLVMSGASVDKEDFCERMLALMQRMLRVEA